MKVLVTGGAGYVGCVLVPRLLGEGYEVRVLDSLRKGALGLLPSAGAPRLELQVGDVRDDDAVARALRDVDAIIHLAAIVGFPACKKDPWLARTTNVDGTKVLINQRDPGQFIIYPSSLSNYGTVVGDVCTEDMVPQPITLYGCTKLESEGLLLESGNAIVFRPATAFGLSPQMRLDLLFNDFVFQAMKHKSLTVFQPQFVRAFVHVSDFARAMIFALEHVDSMTNEVFNLGSEELNLTKGELATKIREQVDFALYVDEGGEDPDKRNYRVDFTKLRQRGFSSTVGPKEGIEELVRAFPYLDVPSQFSNLAAV